MGETPLHVCMIKDSEVHLDIARIMLQLNPALSLDIYENEEYYGMWFQFQLLYL